MNNVNLLKKEFRKKVYSIIKEYENVDFSNEDKIILDKVIATEQYKKCKTILIYYPMSNEVNTLYLIDKAMEDDKIVALPKIINNKMYFIKIEKDWINNLILSSYQILEPISNEILDDFNNDCLMIVPNLALGADKSRIGHGKGYYDIFLSDKKNIFKMGICRSYVLFKSLPTNEDDQKLDMIISN